MKKYRCIYKAKHSTATSLMRAGIIAAMLFGGIRLLAQQNVVNGTIRDAATQKPLFGVRIETAGQPASAISDSLGSFSIKVADFSDVLIFSAPDYAKREIPLQGRKSVDVRLYSTLFTSGYETSESYTGKRRNTINTLSEKAVTDFSSSTSFSIEPEIQARLGGDVRTINHTGVAGSGASMFIRGFNSLNASAQPLIVIDGVVWDNQLDAVSIHAGYFSNPLTNIDSRDIESITILKDGNSIYGSKAANGVILITTTRAKEMATKITANLWWGANMRPDLPKMMNATDYKTYASNQVQGYLKSRNVTGLAEDALLINFPFLNDNPNQKDYYTYHNNTNWANDIYQDGFLQNYSLGVSGGDDVALYALTMGYATNQGYLRNTDVQRLNARFNSDIKLSSHISTKVDLAMTKSLRNLHDDGVNPVTSPTFIALAKSPLLSPYLFTADGAISERLSSYDYMDPYNPMSNPLALINSARGSSSRTTFSMLVNPYYQINKNLQFGSVFNFRQHRVKESFFIPSAGVAPQQLSEIMTTFSNEVRDMAQRQNSIFSDTYLKWNVNINKDNRINLLGGFRFMTDDYQWTLPYGYNTGNDNIKVLVDGLGFKQVIGDDSQWKSMSWYVNANYDFRQKYILSATASADASSRFGQNTAGGIGLGGVRWAVFPSVSGAWVISSENFMRSLPVINLLKLRASYGMTGNDGIDVRANRTFFQSDYSQGKAGLQIGNIQNKAIQWETSKKAGAGLDIHFLDERVSLSADFFESHTDNLLTQKTLSSITGLDSYWSNGGALKNTGYELNLNLKVLDTKWLVWELGGSVGHYKNEITALPDGDYLTQILGANVLTAVGHPAGVFYGYKTDGIFTTTADADNSGLYKLNDNGTLTPYGAGDVRFIDPNGNGIITDKNGGSVIKPNGQTVALKDSRQIIGDPNPDFYGTISSRFKFKKLTLDALFTYSYGNDVYNYLRSQLESGATFFNQTVAMNNRWISEGQVTNIPRAVYGDPMGNNVFSDRWIEDGSYLRLKTLTIAYDIPLNSTYIQGINVWVSANNLLTWTKYLGSDPEFSMNNGVLYQGIDAGLMPQGRSYFFGIKINL